MSVERKLVEDAQCGNREAFAALVRQSIDRLFGIAYRILRDADDAEDAVQQALIETWEDLPDLRDSDRFEAWTFRLVVRASYREAKRRRRAKVRVADLGRDSGMQSQCLGAAGDLQGMVASRDELERAMGELSPEHRAVLVLRYYVGLPITEIGDVLAVPTGTAASRLHYALSELRAACERADRAPVAAGIPA